MRYKGRITSEPQLVSFSPEGTQQVYPPRHLMSYLSLYHSVQHIRQHSPKKHIEIVVEIFKGSLPMGLLGIPPVPPLSFSTGHTHTRAPTGYTQGTPQGNPRVHTKGLPQGVLSSYGTTTLPYWVLLRDLMGLLRQVTPLCILGYFFHYSTPQGTQEYHTRHTLENHTRAGHTTQGTPQGHLHTPTPYIYTNYKRIT